MLKTETVNPFTISSAKELFIDGNILEYLSDEEVLYFFGQLIDQVCPNQKEYQKMVYQNCVDIITQSLRLKLYQDKTIPFTRIFNILYVTLSRE